MKHFVVWIGETGPKRNKEAEKEVGLRQGARMLAVRIELASERT